MTATGRRGVLAGLLAAGALPAGGAAAAPARPLDPVRDQGAIFRKLVYAADERIGFSWLRGTRYGVVDTDPVPLWDMHIGEIFRIRNIGPDRYEVASLQTAFYTDLATGDFLTRFANPLTGRTVEVGYRPPVAGLSLFGPGGPEPDPATLGATRSERTGPAIVEGDLVSVRSDTAVRIPGPGRGTRINDLSTWSGSWREVLDPKVPMPLASHIFSDINTWPAWLGMGDRPGDYYSRCLGRKVARLSDMPATWRALMAERYPAILRDPAAALAGAKP